MGSTDLELWQGVEIDVSAAVAGGQVLAVGRVADVSDGAGLRERLLRWERVAASRRQVVDVHRRVLPSAEPAQTHQHS